MRGDAQNGQNKGGLRDEDPHLRADATEAGWGAVFLVFLFFGAERFWPSASVVGGLVVELSPKMTYC